MDSPQQKCSRTLVCIAVITLVLAGCSATAPAAPSSPPTATARAQATPAATQPPATAVLAGAGDISCRAPNNDPATARLLDAIPGTVFVAGDAVEDGGDAAEFVDCYDRSWGRHRARTRPAVGNHEYGTGGAAPYFRYFGAAAGEPGKGYYSYDLGAWRVVVVNSNCAEVGGCGPDSPQGRWLRGELAARPAPCTLAYWHHARFSSGRHGNSDFMRPIWQALYDAGAELVLAGHDQLYERFAPQDADGRPDPAGGIRQFTVGTGGANLYPFREIRPNSEVRNNDTHGVLKLTLRPTGYDWEFVPVAGKTFTDAGSAACH